MGAQKENDELVALSAEVVSAYVTRNTVAAADLPELIRTVHAALSGFGAEPPPAPEKLTPAVPIRKSITGDYLISLEDGKKYKTLKRHLSVRGMTPGQYRVKWGLPENYPMVAPNYAIRRSEIARSLGLGQMAAQQPRKASKKSPRAT